MLQMLLRGSAVLEILALIWVQYSQLCTCGSVVIDFIWHWANTLKLLALVHRTSVVAFSLVWEYACCMGSRSVTEQNALVPSTLMCCAPLLNTCQFNNQILFKSQFFMLPLIGKFHVRHLLDTGWWEKFSVSN
jgi:hypothetical protein